MSDLNRKIYFKSDGNKFQVLNFKYNAFKILSFRVKILSNNQIEPRTYVLSNQIVCKLKKILEFVKPT